MLALSILKFLNDFYDISSDIVNLRVDRLGEKLTNDKTQLNEKKYYLLPIHYKLQNKIDSRTEYFRFRDLDINQKMNQEIIK